MALAVTKGFTRVSLLVLSDVFQASKAINARRSFAHDAGWFGLCICFVRDNRVQRDAIVDVRDDTLGPNGTSRHIIHVTSALEADKFAGAVIVVVATCKIRIDRTKNEGGEDKYF